MSRAAAALPNGARILSGDPVLKDANAPGYRPIWVERVVLTNFRNYVAASVAVAPSSVVLIGANGSGKTNLLEAISLLAPGQGLRRSGLAELPRLGGAGDWAVAARVHTARGAVDIGTGQPPPDASGPAKGRLVRIDGVTQSGTGVLADHVEAVWLTPAMDGLFTGPAAERRAFLDRLTLCFDAGYRLIAGRFERAMRQRNRLLQDGVTDQAQFAGLESLMAETGVASAAARAEALTNLAATIGARRERDPSSPFPWSRIAVEGWLEQELSNRPAVEVEDLYSRALAAGRERDRHAGRTLIGPHRSDLVVEHGPKMMPAHLCSTGEQKALLVGLVLAHAELLAQRRDGQVPILLLDEVAAHLDEARREALFGEIIRLEAQAWLTGTDRGAFEALEKTAAVVHVEGGRMRPAGS